MASSIGLIYRNEKAQARVDTALAAIIADGKLQVSELPFKTRDRDENDTLRLEWLADVMEAVEASVRKPATNPKAAAKDDAE